MNESVHRRAQLVEYLYIKKQGVYNAHNLVGKSTDLSALYDIFTFVNGIVSWDSSGLNKV